MRPSLVLRTGLGLLTLVLTHVGLIPAWAQDFTAILAHPERPADERALDAGRKPAEVLKFFGVKPGDKVADILAGGGYYTVLLSQLVGETGVVYAANNAFDDSRIDLAVRRMSPPDQDIGRVQSLLGKTVLRFL